MTKPYILPADWETPFESEVARVTELLGKEPRGEFRIVVRSPQGEPSVIENVPFFFDGTPMPTRYWLVDPDISSKVAHLESAGGVKEVQDIIDPSVIEELHERYRIEREAMIDPQYSGPRPSAGVGGTRRGVKCLHTHVAHFLATGNDAVGEWTMKKIDEVENV